MALGNASTMVERLARKGLVERVPYPNDRRVALACLTKEGRHIVAGVTSSEIAIVEKICELLSIDELEAVVRALEILNEGVKRLDAVARNDVAVRFADPE